MNRTLAALSMLAIAAPAMADARDLADPSIIGFGARPCRDWTQSRAAGDPAAAGARQWLYGYATAYNTDSPTDTRPFLSQDMPVVLETIDKSCAARPSISIGEAVRSFFQRPTVNAPHKKHP